MLDPQILRIGKSDHQFHRKAGEIKIAAQPAFCDIDPLGHDLLPALIIGIKRTEIVACPLQVAKVFARPVLDIRDAERSEEHTSELQSLMRISYAVFCLKKKKKLIYMKVINHTISNTHHEIN